MEKATAVKTARGVFPLGAEATEFHTTGLFLMVHSEPLIKGVLYPAVFFLLNRNFVGETGAAGEFKGAGEGSPDVGVGFRVPSAIVANKFVLVNLEFAV